MIDLYQAAMLFHANLDAPRRKHDDWEKLAEPWGPRTPRGSRLAGMLRFRRAEKGGPVGTE